LFAVPVGVLIVLDLFVPPARDALHAFAQKHEVGVRLLEHVLVAGAVATSAIYWVLRRKSQRALKEYRAHACEKPGELVEWSRRETPIVRLGTCKRLAAAIGRSGAEPAVAVLQGRPGSGRTSCVVGLVSELADLKLIPIPLLARRDGSFALEKLAREKFCENVDRVLSSEHEGDAIWRHARSTRDIVVLVDGLDDEIIAKLSTDGGNRFRHTIRELRSREIAVVLATTGELPLVDIGDLREDLDLFNREEATAYIGSKLERDEAREAALAALEKLHAPLDAFLVAPFYVDIVVRLIRAGISLELPSQMDQARIRVLELYLDNIEAGEIAFSDVNGAALHRRGAAAREAAEAVADTLEIDEADRLSVARTTLKLDETALRDAEELNLLWSTDESVGFAGEDLGAYLLATRLKDPSRLLRDIRLVAESDELRKRRDRYVRSALIFWHLQNREKAAETFDTFLRQLKREWTRPAVVVAAVRIACGCGLTREDEDKYKFTRRVEAAADACIESPDDEPWRAHEMLGLVRALAAWPLPEAHQLLWKLAIGQKAEIEWWAAKALAISRDGPAGNLANEIEEALSKADGLAESAEGWEVLNDPADPTGTKISALAWILPALRGTDSVEMQLGRLRKLCLADEMSPLRGEMSLAQGLKLAIINGRGGRENKEVAKNLLLEGRRPESHHGDAHETRPEVRFWHARLVLVQALLAWAWEHRDEADDIEQVLVRVRQGESHPLVNAGIKLALRGLKKLRRTPDGRARTLNQDMYMWSHERDAVRWVELGKDDVARLAADVVLLSNMTYRLRQRHDSKRADQTAALTDLPRCIRRSSGRRTVDEGCDGECEHGLCRDAGDADELEDHAVLATRAQFSASFCRDQARLVGRKAPRWTRIGYGRKKRLKDFWDAQASLVDKFQSRKGRAA
jgi:hypothetical protein